jgi:hypothetical protein
MFTKTLIAVALVVPVFALSGATYAGGIVYQGGPKSNSTMTAAPQTFEIKKPYARYEPGTPASKNRHIYRGGPQTGIPHDR